MIKEEDKDDLEFLIDMFIERYVLRDHFVAEVLTQLRNDLIRVIHIWIKE